MNTDGSKIVQKGLFISRMYCQDGRESAMKTSNVNGYEIKNWIAKHYFTVGDEWEALAAVVIDTLVWLRTAGISGLDKMSPWLWHAKMSTHVSGFRSALMQFPGMPGVQTMEISTNLVL